MKSRFLEAITAAHDNQVIKDNNNGINIPQDKSGKEWIEDPLIIFDESQHIRRPLSMWEKVYAKLDKIGITSRFDINDYITNFAFGPSGTFAEKAYCALYYHGLEIIT